MKVENLSAKRYFVQCKDELLDVLPAQGAVDLPKGADVDYLKALESQGKVRLSQMVEVEDAVIIEDKPDLSGLRAEYKELTGKKADSRWSEAKLKEKIAESTEEE